MEIIGKIAFVGENIAGESKSTGNTWVNKTIVIDTLDSSSKKVAFVASGESRVGDIDEMKLKLGEVVLLRFEPRSREYEGRWFSELSLVKVIRMGEQQELPMQEK